MNKFRALTIIVIGLAIAIIGIALIITHWNDVYYHGKGFFGTPDWAIFILILFVCLALASVGYAIIEYVLETIQKELEKFAVKYGLKTLSASTKKRKKKV